MPASEGRRSVIITFKTKEQRSDTRTDKTDLLRAAISEDLAFVNAAQAPFDQAGTAAGIDINLHEAPILSAQLTEEQIERLKGDANVAAVEDDGLCYALPEALIYEGQPSPAAETVPYGVSMVKAPSAWDASRGKGINIAILDTGIDGTHPDLAANLKGAISFVPGESPMDGHGHGTHCAGTAAAALNGVGVVGVAPAASLYGVKVLANSGAGNWSWLIAGIDWCITNKMHVLSMSLGGGSAPVALETMCNTAFSRGLLIIAAAGNAGPGMNTVSVPGRYKKVVAVSAIDSSNTIANFSSRGPEVELCAPGVNILSCKPGGGYQTMNGTSMACPHVAGGAAVVWGSHRFASNVQIYDLLTNTADNLGVPGWDALYGYGRLDVEQAALALIPAPAMAMKP